MRKKALFISNGYKDWFEHPSFKQPGLCRKTVPSVSDAMYERADFFIIDIKEFFSTRNMSVRYHQLQRLMYEHPSAKLIISDIKPKWQVNHLIDEIRSVTGIEASYASLDQLFSDSFLATEPERPAGTFAAEAIQ